MTTSVDDPLVADYLHRLRRAGRSLPRSQRRELLADIRDHIDAALAGPANEAGEGGLASEADVRNVLDDLGAPEVIVAAALGSGPEAGAPPARSLRDISTIVLLLIGGIVLPVVGWLIGVVLLWTSSSWTDRRKLVATLVWPGGLGPGLVVAGLAVVLPASTGGGSVECTGGIAASSGPDATTAVTHLGVQTCVVTGTSSSYFPAWLLVVLFAAVIVAPIVVAVGLYRSAGRRPSPAATPTGPLAPAEV